MVRDSVYGITDGRDGQGHHSGEWAASGRRRKGLFSSLLFSSLLFSSLLFSDYIFAGLCLLHR